MTKATETIDNKDIEKFIPKLIECIAKPTEVPETVHVLGATTSFPRSPCHFVHHGPIVVQRFV